MRPTNLNCQSPFSVSPLMQCLGVGATSRASFAIHTTRAEIDQLIESLGKVNAIFGD